MKKQQMFPFFALCIMENSGSVLVNEGRGLVVMSKHSSDVLMKKASTCMERKCSGI